ncbi:MAG: CHAT domain-containing protein [Pseudomonadota bacterium]|nr:CHAT domain-containing protein [Pseudomonadota bacterium]
MVYDLRLIIERQNDTYQACWIEPNSQPSANFPLHLPLKPKDTVDLRWYLETYIQFPGAGDRARAQAVEARMAQWGEALFDAVFGSPEGVQVYNNLMNAPAPRLLTLGSTDPEILSQPWEMMRDTRGRRSPLVFQDLILRRQLKGAKFRKTATFTLPLRVLLIVSRPKDTGFIDPRNSIAPLMEALEGLPAELHFCEPPTLDELENRIRAARKDKRPYHIVHFDGHGTYLPKTGVGALAFERDNETTHLVAGTVLGDLLACLDVPLVILEACRGSDLADKPVLGSVAPALLDSGVGSVVAFSHSVHVEAAKLLIERFYRELADGQSVGQALAEGRVKLRSQPARWLHLGPDAETVDLQDWFIPQLYQVGEDPVLLDRRLPPHPSPLPLGKGEREQDISPLPPGGEGQGEGVIRLHNFPPPPLYRFHGRAQELLTLERALRRHPAVLIHAMGGMGKTALTREAADWWLKKRRFDLAVFHSFEQKAGAERVIQLLGQALEVEKFASRPA